ncbi:MAG: helix-turn-helix domain-containing protein [Kiritimatiellae bacterium]|nr:helix-turn-helix domain-containing protein [Kiritimatiellia bacterium]
MLRRMRIPQLIEGLSGHAVAVDWNAQVTAAVRRTQTYGCRARALTEHEIDLVLEGSITGTIDGNPVTLRPGSLFWITPQVPHSLLWPAGLVYSYARFTLRRGQDSLAPVRRFLVLHNAWALEPALKGVCEDIARHAPHKEARLRAWLVLLLSGLHQLLRIQTPAGGTHVLSRFQQDALARHVRRQPAARPTARELARVAKLSPDYFTRVFKNTFGVPPRTWILQQRIQTAAARLLETERPVGAIAEELGYTDTYLFSRQFKNVTGRSPRAFRNNYAAGGA